MPVEGLTLNEALESEDAQKKLLGLSVFDRLRWAKEQGELLFTTSAGDTSQAVLRTWYAIEGAFPKAYFTNHGLYPKQRWDNLWHIMDMGVPVEILGNGYTPEEVSLEYGAIHTNQESDEYERWVDERKHGPLNEVLATLDPAPTIWIQGKTNWRRPNIVEENNGLAQFYPFIDMTKDDLKIFIEEIGGRVYPESVDVSKSPHNGNECDNSLKVGFFKGELRM